MATHCEVPSAYGRVRSSLYFMSSMSLASRLRQACNRLTRSLTGQWRVYRDGSLRRFTRFNNVKWADYRVRSTDSVILVGLFDYNPSIYCYSYVTNHLARMTHAAIETFSFAAETNVVTEKVYA